MDNKTFLKDNLGILKGLISEIIMVNCCSVYACEGSHFTVGSTSLSKEWTLNISPMKTLYQRVYCPFFHNTPHCKQEYLKLIHDRGTITEPIVIRRFRGEVVHFR